MGPEDVKKQIDAAWSLMEQHCVLVWKANLAQLRQHAPQMAGRESAELLERIGAMLAGAMLKAGREVFEGEQGEAFARGARRGMGGGG